jgi:hypothetical protein
MFKFFKNLFSGDCCEGGACHHYGRDTGEEKLSNRNNRKTSSRLLSPT